MEGGGVLGSEGEGATVGVGGCRGRWRGVAVAIRLTDGEDVGENRWRVSDVGKGGGGWGGREGGGRGRGGGGGGRAK